MDASRIGKELFSGKVDVTVSEYQSASGKDSVMLNIGKCVLWTSRKNAEHIGTLKGTAKAVVKTAKVVTKTVKAVKAHSTKDIMAEIKALTALAKKIK